MRPVASGSRAANAPVWAGHPGWIVYVVTTDPAAAAARAAAVAAGRHVPLAPGTWPVDTPADTHRIAVGPVYVAVRTRHGHENGVSLATYYVVRRWLADEEVQDPDPAWPVPAVATPAAHVKGWPFEVVGHRTSPAGSSTFGDEVITWRGRLAGRTITFSTQPRKVHPHTSSTASGSAGMHSAVEHREFVDVLVHHPLEDVERAELADLARSQDPRPVVVRCVGERLRQSPAADRPVNDTPASLENHFPGA